MSAKSGQTSEECCVAEGAGDARPPDASLSFLGAAGEVTGSAFLVQLPKARFLVDCGMFQGRASGEKNAAALDLDARRLDAVVLTHAHIDHSGLLPLIARRGFRGAIHATPATADLLEVMLPDAAHIQEWSATKREGRESRTPGPRAARGPRRIRDEDEDGAPLYTLADAQAALKRVKRLDYGVTREIAPGATVTFRNAGHILGSAIAVVDVTPGAQSRRLVFSGDLGGPGRPMLPDPEQVERSDLLVVESTYGNRLHRSLESTYDEIAALLSATLPRGNVVVPAFAVGRTQEILHVLADLSRAGRVPPLTVIVDSPLARAATEVTARHAASLERETRELAAWQASHPERMRVAFTETPADSMRINGIASGLVIVAASGMADAGRVRHHLRHNLPRAECAVMFTGFQAQGTLGRALVDGAKEVTLFHERIAVRASMHTIGGLSAHADQAGLLEWLRGFRHPPSRTFVVHGEREVSHAFAEAIRAQLAWGSVEVPERGLQVPIIAG